MFGRREIIGAIEGMESLDGLNEKAAGWIGAAVRSRPVKNLLSGTWLGHPLHPLLTDLPIGAWCMASLLDVTAGERGADAARRLVGAGVLAALPAAASGASDWSDTYGAEQRVGHVHAIANVAGTLLQLTSWALRRRGHRGAGAAVSATALGITAFAGFLGGTLSFDHGVGVNRTAFEEAPEEWSDTVAFDDLAENRPVRALAGSVPVVLVLHHGVVRVLSATCVHAGGPLDEGEVVGECLRCPWHGSEFRLSDGHPMRGPAALDQPSWRVKIADGRVLVRPAAA